MKLQRHIGNARCYFLTSWRFQKSHLKSAIFVLYRIFYDNPLRNGGFILLDDERDAILFHGELLSCKPMQTAFPMVPLSVRAWIITTVSFSETCNSLKASLRDAESRNVCIEDCSRDLNGWIFLADFRTIFSGKQVSASEVRVERK